MLKALGNVELLGCKYLSGPAMVDAKCLAFSSEVLEKGPASLKCATRLMREGTAEDIIIVETAETLTSVAGWGKALRGRGGDVLIRRRLRSRKSSYATYGNLLRMA